MASIGWFALHRKLQDHWLWDDKPFAKGQAWIDLLLMANHEDNEFLFGNQITKIEQGSFITSELKLAERWGWGRKKVRLFLELLQNERMLVKKGDNKKTTITIVNYGVYSVFETAKEQQRNSKRTSREHQRNTNNNINNDNNIIKKERAKKESPKTSYDEILLRVEDSSLKELYLEYIKMRKLIKAPMTNRALTMLINKVNELEPNSISRQKKLLEASILNNWKSVYPLKQEKAKSDMWSMKGTYDLDAFEKMLDGKDCKGSKQVTFDIDAYKKALNEKED